MQLLNSLFTFPTPFQKPLLSLFLLPCFAHIFTFTPCLLLLLLHSPLAHRPPPVTTCIFLLPHIATAKHPFHRPPIVRPPFPLFLLYSNFSFSSSAATCVRDKGCGAPKYSRVVYLNLYHGLKLPFSS